MNPPAGARWLRRDQQFRRVTGDVLAAESALVVHLGNEAESVATVATDEYQGGDRAAVVALDPATAARIDAWLQRHAGTWKRVSDEPPQDRITRSRWFERKHRKVDTAVWRHDSVKSAANCGACHVGADRGRFDDDDLRFPAGLGARHRRAWND